MADDKDALAPEIRFKGFTDDWVRRKLGEVADITKLAGFEFTKYVAYSDNGEIIALRGLNVKNGELVLDDVKYIDGSDFSKLSRSKLYKHDILFTYVGTVGELAVVPKNDKYYLAPNVARIRLKDNVNPLFISQQMGSSGFYDTIIFPLIATSSQPALSMENVRKFEIQLTTKSEEISIGNFFRTLDDTITLYKRKLDGLKELKNGYLQQMFPQVGKNVPRVRFAGFTEPWVQRKLGDVVERVQGNDGRMDLPTLTISAGSGWLDQRERFSNNIAGKEQENYTLLSKGELSYNKGNSKLAKYGVVFELKTHKEALVPRVYHSFKTTHESSAAFLEYMFATKIPDSELAKLITSGARMDGLLNIGFEAFMGIGILIPSKAEQITISSFLRNFDEQIAAQQTKLDKLKQLKAAYLQKMFL